MKYSVGDILVTNSPSRRKVLAILDSLVFFSKPNRFDTPDPQPYTEEMIKQKGWKKEETNKTVFDPTFTTIIAGIDFGDAMKALDLMEITIPAGKLKIGSSITFHGILEQSKKKFDLEK